ncbi:SacI homology domain containing protein [Trichomonas vaginalis G3]|uniref:SacI homology domain containing protein n=1 Tax=Trichomonas vaginalis (strain ATCC PRA-98 / G3) TaxID=412133 RepID=A2EHL4_TRIV3|nr:phosphatidylinositol-4-phosphate phosphatase protein [Trichomonas vaginalis G3]EAY07810.1 SacI homology domain containing protein [Trichomonas vaginalis G3]KAI5553420.1 phosphatidylinositol-4-phosphate phosphatase protein [Trichomonas vaginalis G3]|eukprot:XP_001320033.1 SacI homology domain containing protein [Trichomonas vaginalis G3]
MSFICFDEKGFFVQAKGKSVAFNRNKVYELIENPQFQNTENHHTIVDFLGIFDIAGVKLAAVSTAVSNVTSFWGINKVDSFEVYQITTGPVNQEAINLLKKGLSLSPLYYSETVDLSLNLKLQKQEAASRQHFIWNGVAIKHFVESTKVEGLCQPVIAGFITSFKAEKFEFALISRRDAARAGTRFWMRGADEEGHVANFVETEQVVITEKETYSFVQIRGSVPLEWTQYPDLSRLPRLRLADREHNHEILDRHFKTITDEYGKVIAVCLTDHKGKELELTETFNEFGKQAENVRFEYFDFHKECAKMKYQNIDKLVNTISEDLDNEGWTELNGEKVQNGVVRTNCVDCLDRTNVVQSVLARKILDKQLAASEAVCNYESLFRNAWTDNADCISLQYSGTPALKTDFTRTGKRTINGSLNDGANSIKRYYINTCTDGTRQDAYDAVTQSVEIKSLAKENFVVALLIAIFMLIQAIIILIQKGKKSPDFKKKVLQARMRLVNSPRFREIKPAEKTVEPKKE